MNNDPPKRKSILKVVLIGCGTATILLFAVVIGVGIWLSSGQEGAGTQAYHPFRSAEAKQKYLTLYDMRAKRWPVPSESRMAITSYGQTFVRISGPVGAPPLVLLHGAGGNGLQWMPNVEALSERYRTYAVDIICDNGRSIYTRVMKSPDDYVKWLDELFGALELRDHINIVGLSYGGWLATQYALRNPSRLDKIVLLAPVCTVLPLSKEWVFRAVLCAIPHPWFTKSFLYWLAADLAQKGESGRALLEEHAGEAYLALRSFKARRMVNPTVLTDEELRGIKVPVLYMIGENEKICSARQAIRRLNEVAPAVKTELIPHAGHDLTIVQSEMVNRKALMFLGRTATPSSSRRSST